MVSRLYGTGNPGVGAGSFQAQLLPWLCFSSSPSPVRRNWHNYFNSIHWIPALLPVPGYTRPIIASKEHCADAPSNAPCLRMVLIQDTALGDNPRA